MKKLMIAAAIVCAAVASQAASFSWYSDAIGAIAADTLNDGLAANTTYDADSGNTIDDATWTLAYTLTLTYGSESDTLKGTVVTDGFSGALSMDGLESDVIVQDDRTVNYSFTLTGTVEDGNGESWEITSDTINGSQVFAQVGSATLQSGGVNSWTTAPEPTSGLLLLLGMAGLALKRKRA